MVKKISSLKNISVIKLLETVPPLRKLFRTNPRTKKAAEEWTLQGLGTLARKPLDFGLEDLFARLFRLFIGVGGTAGTMYAKLSAQQKNELLIFFANIGTSSINTSPDDLKSWAKTIQNLKAAFRKRSGYGVADAIFRDPRELKEAIRKLKGSIEMNFGDFGTKLNGFFGKIGKKGRFWEVPTTHSGGKTFETGSSSDYGYIDSTHRFQDVSKFSPSFMNKRRLTVTGQGHEN